MNISNKRDIIKYFKKYFNKENGILTYKEFQKEAYQEYNNRISWILHIYKEWIGFIETRQKITDGKYNIGVYSEPDASIYFNNLIYWLKPKLNKFGPKKYKNLSRWSKIKQLIKFTMVEPAHQGSETHYMSVILDFPKKTLVIFDPALGTKDESALYNGSTVYKAVEKLAQKLKLNVYRDLPPNSMQIDFTDVFCQTWSLRYLELGPIPKFFSTKRHLKKKFMKNTILEYIINNKEDFNEYLMMRLNEINSDDTFDSKPGNEIIDDFEKISVLDYIKYASINDLFTVEVVEESDSDEEDEDEDVDKSKDEVKEDKSKDEDVDKSKDEVKEDKSKDEDEDVDKSKDEYKKDEDKEDQDKENIDDLVRKII